MFIYYYFYQFLNRKRKSHDDMVLKKQEYGKITTYDYSSKESMGSIEFFEMRKSVLAKAATIKIQECHTCPGMQQTQELTQRNRMEVGEKEKNLVTIG